MTYASKVMRWPRFVTDNGATAQVEYLIVLMGVGMGCAVATVTLGPLLVDYHLGIEIVLALPVP